MKKCLYTTAIGLLPHILGHTQGLQPSTLNAIADFTLGGSSAIDFLALNHHLQSNVNDVFIGYRKTSYKATFWSYGGIGNYSLIQHKSLQLGSQITLSPQTKLAIELVYNHQRYPENRDNNHWQSNTSIHYQYNIFGFRYLHHWTWNKQDVTLDYLPNQILTFGITTSNKHKFSFTLNRYNILSTQYILQHHLTLSQNWGISWGVQWPNQKYWVAIKNKRAKINSNICFIVQPYFLPSFAQSHEIALDH